MTDILRDELNRLVAAKKLSLYGVARELELKWDSVKNFSTGGMLRSDHLDGLSKLLGMTMVKDPKATPVELKTPRRRKS